MPDRNERISLKAAARRVGKRYDYVKRLVEAGKVRAWEEGGEVRKRLKLYLHELEAAIDRETIYVPKPKPGAKPAPTPRRRPARPTQLDPMVRC